MTDHNHRNGDAKGQKNCCKAFILLITHSSTATCRLECSAQVCHSGFTNTDESGLKNWALSPFSRIIRQILFGKLENCWMDIKWELVSRIIVRNISAFQIDIEKIEPLTSNGLRFGEMKLKPLAKTKFLGYGPAFSDSGEWINTG